MSINKKKNTERKYFFPKYFSYSKLLEYQGQILYIPKDESNQNFIPCFFKKSKESSSNFLIAFHGNGENIFEYEYIVNYLCNELKMNIIVMEYKGYSCYIGDVDSDSILDDSLYVYDYIKKIFGINDKNIFIFGRSMGSAPAVYLSSKRNPNSTFLISAFESIKNIGKGFDEELFEDIFRSIDIIYQVKSPILFIHGKKDNLITWENSKNLYDKCYSEKKKLVLIDDMTHNYFDPEKHIVFQIIEFFKDKNIEIDEKNNVIDFENQNIKKLFIIPSELIKQLKKQ